MQIKELFQSKTTSHVLSSSDQKLKITFYLDNYTQTCVSAV